MKKTAIYATMACLMLMACNGRQMKSPADERFETDSISLSGLERIEADTLDDKYATELLASGIQAPDFALPTPKGDTLRLSDLQGEYVVLDFWASWCPDCRKDLPEVLRLYETYHARGVTFVGISFDDDREAWEAAVEKYALPYFQVSELRRMRESDIAKAYGIKWIPSLYLLSPDGRVLLSTVLSSRIERALQKVVD